MGAIVLFVIAKFIAYCAFCGLAPRWFATDENQVAVGLRWGAVRLLIGVAAGLPIGFAFAMGQEVGLPVFLSYLISFVPARCLEWFVLFTLFARSRKLRFDDRARTWIAMGVGVSLAFDLLAWTAMEFGDVNAKFFC
jgi:hypothetical protein